MNVRRVWLFVAVGTVVVLGGALVAIPVWAAPSRQTDAPASDAYAAMHEACGQGNVQGMAGAMDSLTEEDWAAMQEQMNDGHHGDMGSHMSGEDWAAMEEHMDSGTMSGGGMMGGWNGSWNMMG